MRDEIETPLDLAIAAAVAGVNAQRRKLELITAEDVATCATERQLLRALKMRVTELLAMKQREDGRS